MCEPLNIVTNGAPKCSLKCQFYYRYGNSSCQMSNTGTYLRIKYDGASDVLFNNGAYTPEEVRIYTPSVHLYSGKAAEGELIIVHKGNLGGLLVCVPLTTKGRSTSGSDLLREIITASPSSAEGSKSINLTDFTAGSFIPKERFYTYKRPFFDDCSGSDSRYVVFHQNYAALHVDSDVLKKLQIAKHNISTVEGDVSVNETGTKKNGFNGEGQIYIDCQPTGQSTDEIVYKDEEGLKFKMNPEVVQMIMSALMAIGFVVALYFGFQFVMKYLNGSEKNVKP
jgi:carbonic anhydrase